MKRNRAALLARSDISSEARGDLCDIDQLGQHSAAIEEIR